MTFRLLPASGALAVALSGCASLDPAEDLDTAAAAVTERTGAATGWDEAWHDRGALWDGRRALSADVAVEIALRNNRALRREVETIVAGRADFVQAHLLPNPVVNFAYGFPTDGLGGHPLALSVMQQLAWLWQRPAAIAEADAELRARVLAVSNAALDLVARVRQQHATVRFAERARALQQDSLALLEQSQQLLQARFDVGEATRLDLNRVEMEWRLAATVLADRTAALAVARRTLLEMLGRAEDAADDWRTDDEPDGLDDLAGLDEDAVAELAAAQRLDVRAALAVLDSRAARIDRADAEVFGDVRAGVGLQENFADRPAVFPAVAVTVPVFDDGRAKRARAESEYRQALIEADRVRQVAIAEARRAWSDLQGQRDVVEAYERDIVALAGSNLELARLAFHAGETDLTVLLEAQRQLNGARIELADRRLASARLAIELERAAGGTFTPPDASALARSGGAS